MNPMKVKYRILQELYCGYISSVEKSVVAGLEYAKVSNKTSRLCDQLKE
jgi:hypothetical protein